MTDESLTVQWPGGRLDADPSGPVTIGRDPESTIALGSAAVSRRHGEIACDHGTWTYTDAGSTQGSFVDGTPVGRVELRRPTSVVLGRGPEAVVLELRPPAARSQALVALEPTQWAGGRVITSDAALAPARPGAALTVVRDQPTPPAVRVVSGDQVRELAAGQRLSVGRDADNGLVLAEQSVSRHHLVVEERDRHWTLTDLGSSAGTWFGNERVTTASLGGRQTFRVGDRQTGVTLTTESPGSSGGPVPDAARRSRRRLLVGALAAVLVVLLAGGFIGYQVLSRTSTADLARGTVKISLRSKGQDAGFGSGTIIDKKRGLILTNAHVAANRAPGFAVNRKTLQDDLEAAVDELTIAVTDGLEKTAEPRFRGEVVAADGYLDLAVVKITQTMSGAQLEADDLDALTELSIGDSDRLDSGDEVRVIGYPGAAQSEAPTLTRGVVSGVRTDPRLHSNRSYINTDARINHGNSGGLAADARGRLIGVPTLGLLDQNQETSLYAFRPITFAMPLIEAARAGRTYASPWTTPTPDAATVTALRPVAPGSGPLDAGCAVGSQTSGLLSMGFDYAGFGTPEHADLLAVLDTLPAGKTSYTPFARTGTLDGLPAVLPDSGCATLTFNLNTSDGRLPTGDYRLRIGYGASLRTVGTFTFRQP